MQRVRERKLIWGVGLIVISLAAVGVLTLSLLGSSSVFAARIGDVESAAEASENAQERLDRAVERGKITQDQADEYSEWLADAPDVVFDIRTRIGALSDDERDDLKDAISAGRGDRDDFKARVAEILDVDVDELESAISDNRSGRRGGKSEFLAGVAEDLGVTEEDLTSAYSTAKQERATAARTTRLSALEDADVITSSERTDIEEWYDAAPEQLRGGRLFGLGKCGGFHGKGRYHRHDRGGSESGEVVPATNTI